MRISRLSVVVGLYLGAAVLITWPLAIRLTSHLGALQGPGDPYLNLWILGWGLHAWVTDPLGVLSGRVFDANIFHPAAGALTFSDHFLFQALVLSPVYALTRDAVLCYNLLLIGSIAASGLAMHALARLLTGSATAAAVAGLAWAIWPYRSAHLNHIQLQALYFLPLALLFLHRLVAKRRLADALALGCFAALQAVASVYYGVMTALALGVSAAALAVATGQWRSRTLAGRLIIAAATGALLLAPVVMPYLASQRQQGFGRNLYEAANNAAGLPSYTQVPPTNLLYGHTGILAPREPRPGARDRRGVEHQMFPGAVILALGAIGLWRGWRSDARPATLAGVALVATGVVLSLGPEGARRLYAALYDIVFGFEAIRAPARFAVVAMAGLTMLAAIGVRSIARSGAASRRTALGVLLPALLLVEYANVPLPFVPAPPRETSIGQWLRHAPEPGPVVYLPVTIDIENTPYMVQSLEHRRPIVNGYSGQRPPLYSAIVDGLVEVPSAEANAVLQGLGVRFVVSPGAIAGADTPESPFIERASFPEGRIYEVREMAPGLVVDTPPPPPPGPVPFAAGEQISYEIRWESGPLDLSAGEATLTVGARPEGTGTPGWTFEARAATADWVSRFFEARDRFTTEADAVLRPLLHTREIREGRRQFDRSYLFDHDARVVRMGDTPAEAASPDAISLPVPDGVRDALATFYYVRSLPLLAHTTISLPVNDAGRNLVLHLRVGDVEEIDHAGRRVRALRLQPVVDRRVERRQPASLTLWLSDDERRVPLVVEVSAGFGQVRANLVDYRP